jgi:hypothetical protein
LLEGFAEYYSPADDKYATFIREGIIVLDTNVLLSPYKVASATNDQLFSLLDDLKQQIWIPYHAMWEFFQNRPNVLGGEDKIFQNLEKPLMDAKAKLETHLGTLTAHPIVTPEYGTQLRRHLEDAISLVQRLSNGRDGKLEDALHSDVILEKWEKILNGKIGPEPDNDRKAAYEQAARERYANGIPPGMLDEAKPHNPYGDAIIWLQLLDYVKANPRPVLMVTNDRKDDWYRKQNGRTIGPRVELVREMKEKAGVEYYQQGLAAFMSRASSVTRTPLSKETIDQVILASETQENIEQEIIGILHAEFSDFPVSTYREWSGPAPDVAMLTPHGIIGFELFNYSSPVTTKRLQPISRLVEGGNLRGLIVVSRGSITRMGMDYLRQLGAKSANTEIGFIILDEIVSRSHFAESVESMLQRIQRSGKNKWGQV